MRNGFFLSPHIFSVFLDPFAVKKGNIFRLLAIIALDFHSNNRYQSISGFITRWYFRHMVTGKVIGN